MTFEISVNPGNGSVRIGPDDQILVARLPLEKAAEMLAPFTPEEIDHRNGYRWLWIRHGLTFANLSCAISLCFHHERLSSIRLGVALEEAPRWPDQESIEREVAFMRNEFAKIFLRPFSGGEEYFSWGVAWATFDLKGFQASVGLSYDTPAWA